ncbi:CBS domain-containing protein [Oligoflexus tunisiensis]|uniref:CBS domain-containing protein n=1 Tax=Oligoflexus tunisiensis TaxID=708132 RepID=UPI00114CE374|nr:CBS domain-containing protein [Oligoflexus tunisiensis]
MKAEDIMTRHVVDVMEFDDIYQAFSKLRQYHIHQLVVVNVDSQLCGMVSDRDVLRAWAEVSNSDRDFPRIASIMQRDVITCGPEDPITRITEVMLDHHVHAMPVTDAKRRPIGIISTTDLLRFGFKHLGFTRSPGLPATI